MGVSAEARVRLNKDPDRNDTVLVGSKLVRNGWAQDPSGHDRVGGGQKTVGFASDAERFQTAAERVGLNEFGFGFEDARGRLKQAAIRYDEGRFESAASRSESAHYGVRMKTAWSGLDGFRVVSDDVGLQSDASRFGSAQDGVRMKKVRCRNEKGHVGLKMVAGRYEKVGARWKQVGIRSRKAGFQSMQSGFRSTTSRFAPAGSRRGHPKASSRFEIAMFSNHSEIFPLANTTQRTPRSLAVLAPPRRISTLITFATGVVRGMTGNPTFSSPSPALATVSAAIDDLQAAETVATTRLRGAAATRDARRNALIITLHLVRIYVQSVADRNRENGPAIIQSAGMTVQKTATRKPRVFAALAGASSGIVKIVAPSAGNRASYDWQYSTDGATWIQLASTLQATTTMTDQSPGTRLHLRYRSVTRTGETDWSAPIAVTVR